MEYALQSTKLDPGNAQGYLNVGLCLAEGRNFLEAIAKYDNALEINPAYAEAWLNRGVALSELEHLLVQGKDVLWRRVDHVTERSH